MTLVNILWLPRSSLSALTTSIALVSLISHVQPCSTRTCACQAAPAPAPYVGAYPPKLLSYKYGSGIIGKSKTDSRMNHMEKQNDAEKLRDEFLQVLRSRRSEEGNLMPKLSAIFWFGYFTV